ncbi:MAG: hypothetical protein CL600_12735 [Alteromonas sp.]|jgi:hypothetical protein|uniref:hypothetical protein n=1 Tax=uncultured Alteromonas sp. TaxID=179113 RepID=UPI000C58E373|nr:hypothetical protein [Alteromonas sp.]
MTRSVFVLFTLCLTLQGCSMMKGAHVKDIPQRPIVEEQDTPFVFKEAYQQEGLHSTQTHVVNDNDFVDIEASMQYVWWTPSASLDVFNSPAVDQNNTGVQAPVAHTTPLLSKDTNQSCAEIICPDSSDSCGSIAICDGQVCSEAKRNEYTCTDDKCETVKALHSIEVAKGETGCDRYPERDICPEMTACKKEFNQASTKVSMKQARRLLWEETANE